MAFCCWARARNIEARARRRGWQGKKKRSTLPDADASYPKEGTPAIGAEAGDESLNLRQPNVAKNENQGLPPKLPNGGEKGFVWAPQRCHVEPVRGTGLILGGDEKPVGRGGKGFLQSRRNRW